MLWKIAVLLAALPLAAWTRENRIGIETIGVTDPLGHGQMQGYVLYPTQASDQHAITTLGPYQVHARLEAPARSGRFPLVVISHGSGGSALGHHDLAEALARHGYIVASITHPKDNFADTSGIGTPDVFVGRPRQVSALIDAMLAGEWGQRIDANRIGVAGFSAGGYTGLVLVGAVPRFDLLFGYCARHPKDANLCRFGAEKHSKLAQIVLERLQGATDRSLPLRDARIKAAFVMAPLSVFFDQASMRTVGAPVFLAFGDRDDVLIPGENAQRIAGWLPHVTVRRIAGAGHWTFLAPCSDALSSEAPEICADAPSVDRARVHDELDAEAERFFASNLDGH